MCVRVFGVAKHVGKNQKKLCEPYELDRFGGSYQFWYGWFGRLKSANDSGLTSAFIGVEEAAPGPWADDVAMAGGLPGGPDREV